MEAISRGVFTLICGALVCGGVTAICADGPGAGMRRMLCGLFLTFLVLSPLRQWDFSNLRQEIDVFSEAAEDAAMDGKKQAVRAEMTIITGQCEAYILDKAAELGAEIAVTLELDPETLVPCAAAITGKVTPYEKQMLSGYITQTLGIEKEAQDWNT